MVKIGNRVLKPYKQYKFSGFIVYDCPEYNEVRILDKYGTILASIKYPEIINKYTNILGRLPSLYRITLFSGVYNANEMMKLARLVKKIYDSMYK